MEGLPLFTFLFLSLSLALLGRGRDGWISLSLPCCRWATKERDGWTTSRLRLPLFLAPSPSPSPLVSLGKEEMEGPSFPYLPLTLSSSLSLSLGLLGQGSDGRTFLCLPPSHSFSLPLPHPCSPWARQRWKGSSFLLPSGQGTDRRAFRA